MGNISLHNKLQSSLLNSPITRNLLQLRITDISIPDLIINYGCSLYFIYCRYIDCIDLEQHVLTRSHRNCLTEKPLFLFCPSFVPFSLLSVGKESLITGYTVDEIIPDI